MSQTKQKTVIMPGTVIATEEEYVPGKNTFKKNGEIKSKTLGYAEYDETKKEATVKGNAVSPIKMGDTVIGKVVLVKESMVVIELKSAENGKKITVTNAQIPVRNASTQYVENLKMLFKIGDLVRAKVAMASPLAIDLITNEQGLGVIKAYCTKCRKEMSHSGNKLMCLSCGSVEERRWHTDEQVPRPQRSFTGGPRRSFGERRGFGGNRNNSFRGEKRRPFGRGPRKSFGDRRNAPREGRTHFGENKNRGFGRETRSNFNNGPKEFSSYNNSF